MYKTWISSIVLVVALATVMYGPAQAASAPVGGMVVDESGEPVAGATVSVLAMHSSVMWQFNLTAETRTGEDGRFSFADDAGKVGNPFSFYAAQHPDYGVGWTFGMNVLESQQSLSDLRIAVWKRGSVRGRVTDSGDKPVADATVAAFITLPDGVVDDPDEVFLPPCESLLKATSSSDGSFVLDGLPADGTVILRVSHSDFTTALEGAPDDMQQDMPPRGTISVGAEDVTVRLEPGTVVEGTVTLEETGEPAAGAVVSTMPMDDSMGMIAFVARPGATETDAEGRYALHGLRPSAYSITATHPDGVAAPRSVEITAGAHVSDQDFALERGVLVSGTVLDGTTRQPVDAAQLMVIRDGAMSLAGQTMIDVQSPGTFSFRQLPGEITLMGIRPVEIPSYRPLTLVAGQDQNDVEMILGEQLTTVQQRSAQRIVGAAAFELSVAEWLNGEATTLESLAGKDIVLAFWDSTRESSAEVVKTLNSVVEEHADVVVIAVHSVVGDKDGLQRLIEDEDIAFRVALDKPSESGYPGTTFESYMVNKPPAVYVIDSGCRVRFQDIPLAAVHEALDRLPEEIQVRAQPRDPRQAPRVPDARGQSCANNLKQMGIVFKMYANEHNGMFPEIDDRHGNLIAEGDEIYPEYLTDLNILRCPSVAPDPDMPDVVHDQSYFYLGWVVTTEEEGLALLDVYETLVSSQRDETKIEVGEGKGFMGRGYLWRLREGIERFYITDVDNPRATAETQSSIPVMWERPGHHEDGCNVLYMDGHVEFVPYPGDFPMTRTFIERCIEISSKKDAR